MINILQEKYIMDIKKISEVYFYYSSGLLPQKIISSILVQESSTDKRKYASLSMEKEQMIIFLSIIR